MDTVFLIRFVNCQQKLKELIVFEIFSEAADKEAGILPPVTNPGFSGVHAQQGEAALRLVSET